MKQKGDKRTVLFGPISPAQITLETEHNFNTTVSSISGRAKSDDGLKTEEPDEVDQEVSVKAYFSANAVNGFDVLYALVKQTHPITITDGIVGHKEYTGDAFITSLSLASPTGAFETYDVSFKVDGMLTPQDIT